eukprot:g25120.t1
MSGAAGQERKSAPGCRSCSICNQPRLPRPGNGDAEQARRHQDNVEEALQSESGPVPLVSQFLSRTDFVKTAVAVRRALQQDLPLSKAKDLLLSYLHWRCLRDGPEGSPWALAAALQDFLDNRARLERAAADLKDTRSLVFRPLLLPPPADAKVGAPPSAPDEQELAHYWGALGRAVRLVLGDRDGLHQLVLGLGRGQPRGLVRLLGSCFPICYSDSVRVHHLVCQGLVLEGKLSLRPPRSDDEFLPASATPVHPLLSSVRRLSFVEMELCEREGQGWDEGEGEGPALELRKCDELRELVFARARANAEGLRLSVEDCPKLKTVNTSQDAGTEQPVRVDIAHSASDCLSLLPGRSELALTVSDCPYLPFLCWPELKSAAGRVSLVLQNCPALQQITFPQLSQAGNLSLQAGEEREAGGLAALTQLDLPLLAEVAGELRLRFEQCGALRGCRLPLLAKAGVPSAQAAVGADAGGAFPDWGEQAVATDETPPPRAPRGRTAPGAPRALRATRRQTAPGPRGRRGSAPPSSAARLWSISSYRPSSVQKHSLSALTTTGRQLEARFVTCGKKLRRFALPELQSVGTKGLQDPLSLSLSFSDCSCLASCLLPKLEEVKGDLKLTFLQ